MFKEDLRDIYFLDLIVEVRSRAVHGYQFVPMHMARLLSQAKELHEKKLLNNYEYNRGRDVLYLQDISIIGDVAVLLINHSDKRAADPALANATTKSHRVVKKRKGEGLGSSTHVVVNLEADRADTYITLLETVPGITTGLVARFIGDIIKQCKKVFSNMYQVEHPNAAIEIDGSKKKVSVNYTFRLDGHLSDEFISELNAGTLFEIDLYTEVMPPEWDKEHLTIPVRQQVKLKPAFAKGVSNYQIIKSAFNAKASRQYEFGKVRFADTSEKEHGVTLSTDTLISARQNDLKYIKRKRIKDFNLPLPAMHAEIHQEISSKMIDLLI